MVENRSARERLIVALDCPTITQGLKTVDTLGDEVAFYKVGWRLFVQGGMSLVEELHSRMKDVFLDLKMFDIGETIETAVASISDDAMFLTVAGNAATVRAAAAGRGEHKFPKLLYVPMLSSQDESDLEGMTPGPRAMTREDLNAYIVHRSRLAIEAGADGLIVSGDAVPVLRAEFPNAILVTPGVRPAGSSADDHKRSLTPGNAIASGSDFLVVGRPIWASDDPVTAARQILAEMDEALAARV